MAQTDNPARNVEPGSPPVAVPASRLGLSEREAAARRAAGQGNKAPPPTGRTYRQIVRENVFTFINNILFVLGSALVAVGRPLDAAVSVGVIAVNILVSVVQEIRAKRTLDRIALLTRPTATVLRDGHARALAPDLLVIGDMIQAEAGDQIVLDGQVRSGRMRVDESQLTGESDLVPKEPGDPVYSGSFCANGAAVYGVEKVGSASLAQQITAGARTFRRVLTPLQRQINLVIRVVLLIVLYLQLLLVGNALVNVVSFRESIGQATILASLVPNGLFLSIAVAYALGAVRILRSGALVQQANAIESLSHVDVLCLDKTGTLTANRLEVACTQPLGIDDARFQHLVGVAVSSTPSHNKTAEAIAAAFPAAAQPLLREVPFSSVRKWSAVAIAGTGADSAPRGIFALGAPELLQPFLGDSAVPGGGWPAIAVQAHGWAERGLRVLLLAHHPDPLLLEDRGDESELPAGMIPLGLIGLRDQLRPEARTTLASFLDAGVTPKIISGDNPETVAALALQAGLPSGFRSVSGLELAQLSPPEFSQAAEEITVFGRITPQQKESLIAALRARGHYVAMIGDGVNDVLSLKKANLAIALQSGSQAARAVADLVLVNDSFAALAPAVLEGQRILNGLQAILKLFLARISTVALVILAGMVVGTFPLAVRNSSVITLLTVGMPTIFLALWARPGVRVRASLTPDLWRFVVPAAVCSSLLGLVVFYGTMELRLWEQGMLGGTADTTVLERATTASTPYAQTALSTFLVCCGLLLVIFVEPPIAWWRGSAEGSGDWRPTMLAMGLMLIFVLISTTPSLRSLAALSPLELDELPLVIAALVVWLVLLRLFWRWRLIERFLEVGTSEW